jgi:hypothetical protein
MSAADIDDELFSRLAVQALDRSVVARLLGDSLEIAWDLRPLHGAQPAVEGGGR